MSESGGIATAVVDGFQVSSNTETSEQIKLNLESEPAPKDGTPLDPEEEEKAERRKAAAKLGKAGGEAAAKAIKAKPEPQETPEPVKSKEEAEEPEEAPEKPSRAQARIQQLARERSEERSKRIELEQKLDRLIAAQSAADARGSGSAPVPPHGLRDQAYGSANPTPPEEPRPDGFETYEDYVKAVARHAARSERDAVLREQAEAARQQAHADTVVKRVEDFNKRIKANPAVMEQVDPRLLDLQPTFTLPPGPDGRPQVGPANVLADEIVGSENPDKLLLYLSQHEDEVRKILSSKDPYELARRVGMVEARLGIEAAPAEPSPAPEKRETYSKAAPPVRPVTPSAVSDDDVDSDDDFDSYVKRANARDARIRRG